jgi:hypothetical protein
MATDDESYVFIEVDGGHSIQPPLDEVKGCISPATSLGELLRGLDRLETSLDIAVALVTCTVEEPQARVKLWGEIESARKELRAARCSTQRLEGLF